KLPSSVARDGGAHDELLDLRDDALRQAQVVDGFRRDRVLAENVERHAAEESRRRVDAAQIPRFGIDLDVESERSAFAVDADVVELLDIGLAPSRVDVEAEIVRELDVEVGGDAQRRAVDPTAARPELVQSATGVADVELVEIRDSVGEQVLPQQLRQQR